MARRVLPAAAVIATASSLLSGCGAATGSERVAAGGARRSGAQIVCDQAVAFRTLHQLRRRAGAVVVFRATPRRRVERIGAIPFTVSQVTVLRRVAGRRVPTTIGLRQTGGPGVNGCSTPLSSESTYVAFLTPFTLRPGGPTIGRQYVAAGLFRSEGAGIPPASARAFANVTPGQPRLPVRISITQARAS